MIKHIPNTITLLNLFCGAVATIFAVQNNLQLAAVFVVIGIGFDFLDGFAARILKVQSDLGLQLDSLADMVTSGLVPGIVMYQLLGKTIGQPFYMVSNNWGVDPVIESFGSSYISFVGLLITLASAYRLAKFNIDTRQTNSFVGLPTPANTLLIMSLPLILIHHSNPIAHDIIGNRWFLIGLTVLSCILLNAELPLFSLKFKNWGVKDNKTRYAFLLLSVILIAFFQFIAIPLVILMYILLSILANRLGFD